MPDEDNNFGGSLVSDFWKWWRHVQPKNTEMRMRRVHLSIRTGGKKRFQTDTAL